MKTSRRTFLKIFGGAIATAAIVPYTIKKVVKEKKLPTIADIKQQRFDIISKMSIKIKQDIQREEDQKIFAAIEAAVNGKAYQRKAYQRLANETRSALLNAKWERT